MPSRFIKISERLAKSKVKSQDDAMEDATTASKRKVNSLKSKEFRGDAVDKTVVQTPKILLTKLRHHFCPSFNRSEHPLSVLDDLHAFPSVQLSVPYAAYVSNQRSTHYDICQRRTLLHDSYCERLQKARSAYHKHKNRQQKRVAKFKIFPLSAFELAKRLESNPDPYFNGAYDYFYTGGSLCVLPYDASTNHSPPVVFVNGAELQNLNVSHFVDREINSFSMLNLHSSRRAINQSSELYEVRALKASAAGDMMMAGRQRNCVTLFWLLEDKEALVPLTQFKSGTDEPLISFAQSSNDTNQLALSSMRQTIKIFDMETSALKYQTCVTKNRDDIGWNVLRSWDNTYLYANEHQLCISDMRSTPEQWFNVHGAFNANTFNCNKISNIVTSQICPYFVYLATAHNLHCCDMRFLDTNRAHPFVCTSTHQMEYPPTFIDTLLLDNTEIVAMSSAQLKDLRIIELTASSNSISADSMPTTSYFLHSMPYWPPSTMEAYQTAHSHGLCLQPESDLRQRLQSSTVGLCFLTKPDSQPPALLTSNSLGDVFVSTLRKRAISKSFEEERTNDASDETIKKYEETICEKVQPVLSYTATEDMSDIRKFLLSNAFDTTEEESERHDDTKLSNVECATNEKRTRFGRWQKSLTQLHSYKDALVTDLLAVWDIPYDEEEKSVKLKDLDRMFNSQSDSKSRVKNWLKTETVEPIMETTIRNISTMSDNTRLNISPIRDDNDEEFLPNVMSTKKEMTLANTSGVEPNERDLTIAMKPPKPKKRKYVKGF